MDTRKNNDYFLARCDNSELLSLFLSHFTRAQQISDTVERFHNEDNGNIMDVYFSNDSVIEKIKDNLEPNEFKILQQKIKNTLLDNNTERIGQVICFSHEKISGSYKYKDLFQIIPIPAEAPQAPYVVADQPFILQFKYTTTPDFIINNTRRTKQSSIYIRYLNAILKTRIFGTPRYNNQLWTWKLDNQGHSSVEWVQQGYNIDNFKVEVERFAEDLPPITLIPSAEYYNLRFGRSSEPIILPDNVTILLDKILNLDQAKQKMFNMAATWFYQAQDIWPHSNSSTFIAIVCAIESLLDKNATRCEDCGQPKFSVNKKFIKFLETYVPDIDKFPDEKKIIYKTRSDLAHGSQLLLSDLEPWQFMMNMEKTKQDSLQRKTYEIVATALVNWLSAN